MKISRGRNPEFPEPSWHGFSAQHCVSRSVRDSAAVLDATQGPTPGDRWWAPPPARPYLQEVGAPPGWLRIAFTTTDFLGRRAHAECVAAVESTAQLCESLGHHVEEAAPEIETRDVCAAILDARRPPRWEPLHQPGTSRDSFFFRRTPRTGGDR